MGKCAALLNIKFYSSEIGGQSTFLPFSLPDLLVPGLRPQWWVDRTKECSTRIQCVSKYLISMHYVTPERGEGVYLPVLEIIFYQTLLDTQ